MVEDQVDQAAALLAIRWYFLYRYILRLGFLDGRAGFLYHFSQALLFRIMLDARLEELKSSPKK